MKIVTMLGLVLGIAFGATPASLGSELNEAAAMKAVFGNYSARLKLAKVSVPEARRSGEFGEEGKGSVGFFKKFKEGGAEKAILVTAVVPADEVYDCHACAPYVGYFLFAKSGSGWRLEFGDPWGRQLGGYGIGPAVSLVRIGPERHAIEVEVSGMSSGWASTSVEVLLPEKGSFASVLTAVTDEDTQGACDEEAFPCQDYFSAELRYEPPAKSGFYSAVLESEGVRVGEETDDDGRKKARAFRTRSVYELQGGRYVLKKEEKLALSPSLRAVEAQGPKAVALAMGAKARARSAFLDADRKMSAAYFAKMKAKGMSPKAKAALKSVQLAWIREKESACAKLERQDDRFSPAVEECLLKRTLEREKELAPGASKSSR